MICVSAGSKSGLAKAAGAEVAAQSRQEKFHAAVARSKFQVKIQKNLRSPRPFGSSDVQKLQSQNAQNTSAADRFLKFGSGKIARRCGAKRIFKSKCTKHLSGRPLFEVWIWQNCTPLWREAHFQVKMYKTPQRGAPI